jgi:hypothetical protein
MSTTGFDDSDDIPRPSTPVTILKTYSKTLSFHFNKRTLFVPNQVY